MTSRAAAAKIRAAVAKGRGVVGRAGHGANLRVNNPREGRKAAISTICCANGVNASALVAVRAAQAVALGVVFRGR